MNELTVLAACLVIVGGMMFSTSFRINDPVHASQDVLVSGIVAIVFIVLGSTILTVQYIAG